mgnify:CR=1 FL=1
MVVCKLGWPQVVPSHLARHLQIVRQPGQAADVAERRRLAAIERNRAVRGRVDRIDRLRRQAVVWCLYGSLPIRRESS